LEHHGIIICVIEWVQIGKEKEVWVWG